MFIGKVGEEERSIAFLVSCMNTGTSIKSFLQAFFLLSYVEFSCGHACDIINPRRKSKNRLPFIRLTLALKAAMIGGTFEKLLSIRDNRALRLD